MSKAAIPEPHRVCVQKRKTFGVHATNKLLNSQPQKQTYKQIGKMEDLDTKNQKRKKIV